MKAPQTHYKGNSPDNDMIFEQYATAREARLDEMQTRITGDQMDAIRSIFPDATPEQAQQLWDTTNEAGGGVMGQVAQKAGDVWGNIRNAVGAGRTSGGEQEYGRDEGVLSTQARTGSSDPNAGVLQRQGKEWGDMTRDEREAGGHQAVPGVEPGSREEQLAIDDPMDYRDTGEGMGSQQRFDQAQEYGRAARERPGGEEGGMLPRDWDGDTRSTDPTSTDDFEPWETGGGAYGTPGARGSATRKAKFYEPGDTRTVQGQEHTDEYGSQGDPGEQERIAGQDVLYQPKKTALPGQVGGLRGQAPEFTRPGQQDDPRVRKALSTRRQN